MATIPPSQGAIIFWDHFDMALEKVREKHGQRVEPELLEVLIRNHLHFRELNVPFMESVRYALNASCIRAKHRRVLYASALSFYYNPRAVIAALRRKASELKPLKRTRPPLSPHIILERHGQLSFLV